MNNDSFNPFSQVNELHFGVPQTGTWSLSCFNPFSQVNELHERALEMFEKYAEEF